MRHEFVCSFEKSLVRVERDDELLAHHVNGLLQQLYLMVNQPNPLSKGKHFVLLLEKDESYTDKVSLTARLCSCYLSCENAIMA